MTVVHLNPATTTSNTGTVTGAGGDADLAMRDGDDATYITFDIGEAATFTLDDLTLPSGAVLIYCQGKFRAGAGVPGVASTLSMSYTHSGTPVSQSIVVNWSGTAVDLYAGSKAFPTDAGIDAASLTVRCGTGTLGTLILHECSLKVLYYIKPVVTVATPTGTLTDDNSPTVTWSTVWDPDFTPITGAYQVKVFSAAQYGAGGFDPDTSDATLDSGVQTLSPASTQAHEFTETLDNDTYRAFVKVSAFSDNPDAQWSAWDYEGFVVSVTPPGTPQIVAFAESSEARNRLIVAVPDTNSYNEAVLDLTPSLYWALDSTNGATDLSGNSHTGTGTGGVTIGGDTTDVVDSDSSTDFDGTDDRIQSSYDPFVSGTSRTFCGWAYRDASANADVLFGSAATTAIFLRLESGSNSVIFDTDSGTAPSFITWTNAWPGNTQWVFWALVFDDTTDQASLYINGALVSTQTFTGVWEVPTSKSFQLGARGGSDYFDGKMGHVAVFEYGLTAVEIASLYDLAINGSTSADLVEIEASYDGGGTWQSLRTPEGDGIVTPSSGGVTAYDWEAPNGYEAMYRVRSINEYTGTNSYSGWATTTGTWESAGWWLKHPTDPTLSYPVRLRSFQGHGRAARQSVQQPLGRDDAVIISDTRGPQTGEIVFWAEDDDTRDAIMELASTTVPLLLQHPSNAHEDDRWIALGDESVARLIDKSWRSERDLSYGWTEVARPSGSILEWPASSVGRPLYTPEVSITQLEVGVYTQGTALMQANNAAYRYSNALMRSIATGNPTQVGTAYTARDRIAPTTSTQGNKWTVEFDYTGAILEVHVLVASTASYWFWVDDKAITATPSVAPSPTTGFRILQLNFGSSAKRKIRIEGGGANAVFNGVRSGGDVLVEACADSRLPILAWVGDSYGDGRKATNELMGFVRTLGRLLNMEGWQFPSYGGQGLVYESSAGLQHIDRMPTDLDPISPAPDIIVVQGSINDALGSWSGNVGPAMVAAIAEARAEHPTATIAATSPLFATTPSSTVRSIAAEIEASMASSEPNTLYIDAVEWFTGTSSAFLDADGNHPNQTGHDAYAVRMAEELAAIL